MGTKKPGMRLGSRRIFQLAVHSRRSTRKLVEIKRRQREKKSTRRGRNKERRMKRKRKIEEEVTVMMIEVLIEILQDTIEATLSRIERRENTGIQGRTEIAVVIIVIVMKGTGEAENVTDLVVVIQMTTIKDQSPRETRRNHKKMEIAGIRRNLHWLRIMTVDLLTGAPPENQSVDKSLET